MQEFVTKSTTMQGNKGVQIQNFHLGLYQFSNCTVSCYLLFPP